MSKEEIDGWVVEKRTPKTQAPSAKPRADAAPSPPSPTEPAPPPAPHTEPASESADGVAHAPQTETEAKPSDTPSAVAAPETPAAALAPAPKAAPVPAQPVATDPTPPPPQRGPMSTASAETPATRSLDSMLISIRQNEARRRDPKLGKGQLVGIPSEELARGGGRGALLERAQGDKKHRYELEGWPVKTGTLIEVYTNVVNRWIRGRFDGRTDEPKLVIQILDPNGPWDESGLNPQVGTWEVPVFEGAICRWPPR